MSDETLPAHRDPMIVELAASALRELHELVPSLVGAVLLTDDGFEISRAPQRSTDERLASMASSLQALSEAVVRELSLGDAAFALIEATDGRVLLRRIAGAPIVLAGVFGDEETLGRAISVSRKIADDLAAALTARD